MSEQDEHSPSSGGQEPASERTPATAPSAGTDLTGDEALDERLAKPVFEGYTGLDKAQVAIGCFLIVLIGITVFSMSLGVPFHHEDRERIVNNTALHSIWTISEGWDPYVIRPLTAVTIALNWAWGGGNAFAFHFFSVAIHILNGILVYLLCRRVLRHDAPEPVCMAAGLLFAVHPIVTHGVNSVSHRGVLLAACFTLVSVLWYLRATDRPGALRLPSYAGSMAAFLLAWGAGVTAWIIPFLITAADIPAGNHTRWRDRLAATGPFWLLLVMLLTVHRASGAAGEDFLSLRAILVQGSTMDLQTLLPVGLSVAHAPFEASVWPLLWLFLLVIALVDLRFLPVLGFGLFWYVLAIAAPGMYDAQPVLREEHQYLPLAGLVVIVPWIFQLITRPNTRMAAGFAVTAVVVVFGALTFLRNQVWQSEEELWLDARGACPTCFEPAQQLGSLYLRNGETFLQQAQQASTVGDLTQADRARTLAMASFGRAEEALLDALNHTEEAPAVAWLDLGTAQRYLGKPDAARESLEQAILKNPTSFRALFQLAILTEGLALETGNPRDRQRAIEYYADAAQYGLLPQEALERFGLLLAQGGDPARSAAVLRQAVANAPGGPAAQALAQLEQREARIRELQARALELFREDPESSEGLTVTAHRLFLQGNYLQSTYLIESVFRDNPPTRELWYLLGANKARMNSFGRFLDDWSEPPANGDDPWYELAKRVAESGDWVAASQAVERIPEGDREERPLFTLARIAQEVNNVQRASAYLHQAADEVPGDPAPWLRLAELAIAVNQAGALPRFLSEAETRGAPDTVLEALRERAGVADDEPVRRFIRPN